MDARAIEAKLVEALGADWSAVAPRNGDPAVFRPTPSKWPEILAVREGRLLRIVRDQATELGAYELPAELPMLVSDAALAVRGPRAPARPDAPSRRDYRMGDLRVPSVSEVIGQLKSVWRGAAIEAAADLGTATHRLIERSMAGEHVGEVPGDLAPAWEAWRAWRAERAAAPVRTPDGRLASELSLVTPAPWAEAIGFGGTLDLVVEVAGGRFLADVKTRTARDGKLPTPDRCAYAQVGAYSVLWRLHYPALPLDGALVLVLGRTEPVYRECWVPREDLESSAREFLALRTALAEHEGRKTRLAAARRSA